MAIKFATVWFTDYCSNDCRYCVYSRDNWDLKRNRLTKKEILSRLRSAFKGGMDHFLLAGGMDLYFDDDKIVDIIQEIKREFPSCRLYLSIGEKYIQSYERFQKAGADGYILYHRSADPAHFEMLHSMGLAGEFRKQCLFVLKDMGFEVGSGITVGWPYQSPKTLAADLTFLEDLKPDIIVVEPFRPQKGTVFENEPAPGMEAVKEVAKRAEKLFPKAKVLLPKDFIMM